MSYFTANILLTGVLYRNLFDEKINDGHLTFELNFICDQQFHLRWVHFIGIFILCLMYKMNNEEQHLNGTVEQWSCFQSKWRGIRLISNTSSVLLSLGFPYLSGSNCCATYQTHKPRHMASISSSTTIWIWHHSFLYLYISKFMHDVINHWAEIVSVCQFVMSLYNMRIKENE